MKTYDMYYIVAYLPIECQVSCVLKCDVHVDRAKDTLNVRS